MKLKITPTTQSAATSYARAKRVGRTVLLFPVVPPDHISEYTRRMRQEDDARWEKSPMGQAFIRQHGPRGK